MECKTPSYCNNAADPAVCKGYVDLLLQYSAIGPHKERERLLFLNLVISYPRLQQRTSGLLEQYKKGLICLIPQCMSKKWLGGNNNYFRFIMNNKNYSELKIIQCSH